EEEGGKKKRRKKASKGSKKAKAPEKLAAKLISIDDDKIFEPTLQIIAGKGKVINDLRKAAHSAEAVYLAGDPDREGEAISAHLAMVLSKPAKFIEQEPSVSRFKKKEAAPEEPVKKEEENGAKKEVVAIDPKKIFRVTFNEIRPRPFAQPSIAPGKWTPIWWMRSRRAACSIASWAIRFPRFSGIKCAAGFPPDGCRRWRCG